MGIVLLALVIIWAPGCGPGTGKVSGVVMVDNQPLQKGDIFFVPANGAGPSATAPITDGRYQLEATVGDKIVQISAPVVHERRQEMPDGPWTEFTRETLPARYNSASVLVYEVTSGENTKDWHVSRQAKRP